MFDIKVVRRIEIPTIDETTLKEMLKEVILTKLPEGAIIDGIDFNYKRNPPRVELNVQAKFDSEPEEQLELFPEPTTENTIEDKPKGETVADILGG